jgi:hypothetical protein
MRFGCSDAPQQKGAVEGLGALAQHAQRNLRCGAEVGGTQTFTLVIDDRDGIAGLRFAALGYVT